MENIYFLQKENILTNSYLREAVNLACVQFKKTSFEAKNDVEKKFDVYFIIFSLSDWK